MAPARETTSFVSSDPAGIGQEPVPISLAWLRPGRPVRGRGIDEAHVERLAAHPEWWAPILVAASDHRVIDGQHRVAAARRLGLPVITATLFRGSEHEALVEWVRRNLDDGLGLSMPERQRAVRRILRVHPEWADRRIGALCAVSPKAVARTRAQMLDVACSQGRESATVRIGRDGRARPVDAASQRAKVVEALRESPGSSLRAIAAHVGVSPETVRRVRTSMERAEPGVPPPGEGRVTEGAEGWLVDTAFMSRGDSADTAAFFERTNVAGADAWAHAGGVPLSRVYEVADEARRRAAFWARLAELAEARAKPRSRG